MSQEIERLRGAGIPPFADKTTLEVLRQPAMRSIVTDKAYLVDKTLRSFVFTADKDHHRVPNVAFARFCAELVLSSIRLRYVPAALLGVEIAAYYRGDAESPFQGNQTYLAIPDLVVSEKDEVLKAVLADHVSRGGPLLLLLPAGNQISGLLGALISDAMVKVAIPVGRHV